MILPTLQTVAGGRVGQDDPGTPQDLLPPVPPRQARLQAAHNRLHHLPVRVGLTGLQVVHQLVDLVPSPVLGEVEEPDHGHPEVGGGVGGEGEVVLTLCLVLGSVTTHRQATLLAPLLRLLAALQAEGLAPARHHHHRLVLQDQVPGLEVPGGHQAPPHHRPLLHPDRQAGLRGPGTAVRIFKLEM